MAPSTPNLPIEHHHLLDPEPLLRVGFPTVVVKPTGVPLPNAKIYLDHFVWVQHAEGIAALLPQLRDLLCSALNVGSDACQIVALEAYGLPDQPQINFELHILPAPDRTRDLLISLAEAIRRLLETVTVAKIAVRIATLDPKTYVALK
jgi:hypothetical protein